MACPHPCSIAPANSVAPHCTKLRLAHCAILRNLVFFLFLTLSSQTQPRQRVRGGVGYHPQKCLRKFDRPCGGRPATQQPFSSPGPIDKLNIFCSPPKGGRTVTDFFLSEVQKWARKIGKPGRIRAGQGKFRVKKIDFFLHDLQFFGPFCSFHFVVPGLTLGQVQFQLGTGGQMCGGLWPNRFFLKKKKLFGGGLDLGEGDGA